jgi:hypothetical protein
VKKSTVGILLLFYLGLSLHSSSYAYTHFKQKSKVDIPTLSELHIVAHDTSEVLLGITNRGPIGHDLLNQDYYGIYPRNHPNNKYIFGMGLWVGAIYDANDDGSPDTVSCQAWDPATALTEFREGRDTQTQDDPLARIFDSTETSDHAVWPPQFSYRGTGNPIIYSDQDLVTSYTTKDMPPLSGEFQLPLEIDQRSMVFLSSFYNSSRVVFIVFAITNTSDEILEDAWVGIDSDMDIMGGSGTDFTDDRTSVILDWIQSGVGDTVNLNMGFAYDSNFEEDAFVGTPGFVGVSLLLSPGKPEDGFDNDGDGLIDESTFNSIDDDRDGLIDEWDEVDEIGLVNFSKHCTNARPCELNDPTDDRSCYDYLSCNTPNSPIECLESFLIGDIRFMISSGPFDWQPGQKQIVAIALVFANPAGNPPYRLQWFGNPPRPDPNDPILQEFVNTAKEAREFFLSSNMSGVLPGDLTGENEITSNDLILMVAMIVADSVDLIADMNEDGDVNICDLVLLLRVILGIESPIDQDPENLLDLVDVDLYAEWIDDGVLGVSLGLSHGHEVGGLELWLRYDRSMYNIDDVELLSHQEGLDIAYRDNDGLVKVLVYGLSGMAGAGGQAVCRIDLRPEDLTSSGNSGITVEKVILSDLRGSFLDYALNGIGEDGEIALVYPRSYRLYQNYPNPFNPSTTISYDIPDGQERVDVGLRIYDLRGRLVRKLVDTESLPGRYAVQWDGRSDRGERVSSGVYFYQIIAGDFVSTRKLVVIK